MVLCMVLGCSVRSGRDKNVSFFRVPAVVKDRGEQEEELSHERRMMWISAISREKLTEKILCNDRVCSKHFVSGRPSPLWDKHNVDWVPTLNLGHSKRRQVDHEAMSARADRVRERRKRGLEMQALETASKVKKLNEPGETICSLDFNVVEEETDEKQPLVKDSLPSCSFSDDSFQRVDQGCQTEEFDYMFEKTSSYQPFCESYFSGDDDKVRFYTGLPCFSVLKTTLNHVAPHVDKSSKSLTQFQEFILVLIRLRLNVFLQDLAYRFGISRRTVNRIISTWMEVMDARLSPLISWPDRESLWATMPQCFQYSFGKRTTVILDCFEIFIDRPSNLLARAQTFSNYKHHNTIKVLIGITPQGTISFVSEAWGGRTSDKYLTENCGILEKLLPGDMVMADRGFTIHDSVMYKQASLVIPAFTKGKSQLDPIDVERTRGIANVRIHVERVIGLLRRKYTILQGTLPIDLLKCNPSGTVDSRVPMIDRIIRVCSALINLCPPIIPFD